MSEVPNQPPADSQVAVRKTHARPGSQWNASQRKSQKGFSQPKGFARGARIK